MPEPTSNGDWKAGYAALDSSAALVALPERRLIRASGTERKEYLQGQLTNDVCGLGAGGGCAAALLTSQGRVVALTAVYDIGPELWLASDAANLERLLEGLSRFLVADDCELDRVGDVAALAVAGPGALEALRGAGLAVDAPGAGWWSAEGRIAGQPVRVLARGELRVPVLELVVSADAGGGTAGEGLAAVRAALETAGARPADPRAVETVRVESGAPLVGVDVDERRIAVEARLEWAIHFAKGCYVGQEVIERVVSRGRANRLITLLALEGRVDPGDPVEGAGEQDAVTSVAESPRLGPIALAYVPRALSEEGSELRIVHGGTTVPARALAWPRPRVLAGR